MVNNKLLVGLLSLLALTTTFFNYGSYYGEDINFQYESSKGDKVNIQGKLQTPSQLFQYFLEKPSIALIVPDSGFTDSSCNSSVDLDTLNTDSYIYLANALKEYGMATVRYNKRNISPSYTSQNEFNMTFEDQAEDVAEIVQQLKSSYKFGDIYIIGHGEGSSVSMYAINNILKGDIVSKFVTLNGYGFNAKDIIEYNLKFELTKQVYEQSKQFLNKVEQGLKPSCTPEMDEFELCNSEYGIFRPSILTFLNSLFQFSPSQTFSQMNYIETYLVQGTVDLQVIEENAFKLQESNQITANNQFYGDMNHILKNTVEDRIINLSTFTNVKQPIDSKLGELISKFCLSS